jgi:hypothetical protein
MRKLESISQSRTREPMVFRYGRIQHLPPDTKGERHIAIVKTEPTPLANVQHCKFEDRVGPAAEARDDLSFTVYLNAEDENGNSR